MSQVAEQYKEQGICFLNSKMRIQNYWTQRSHDFAQLRLKELNSVMAERWLREIAKHIPREDSSASWMLEQEQVFFAFLLSSLGHRVTGIDLTPSMIQKAKEAGRTLQSSAQFPRDGCRKIIICR